MRDVVTGATGKFGRHVIETLLDQAMSAGEIVAAGRSIDTIGVADGGVYVRVASYDEPDGISRKFSARLATTMPEAIGAAAK